MRWEFFLQAIFFLNIRILFIYVLRIAGFN